LGAAPTSDERRPLARPRLRSDYEDRLSIIQLLPYLNGEARENLRNYQYSGGDQGFVFKLFYNPFATWVVGFLPEWLAPNVITTIGFFFSFLPFGYLFYNYGTHFYNQEVIAPSFYYLQAICYFLYRMFDEMDGK
jgi:hypothetical protein